MSIHHNNVFTLNSGGWTLIAYAGIISPSKEIVSGMSSSFYSPLIFSWGNINATALSSKSSFSRFDLFKPYAKATDEFMVRRTSNPSKIIIFPIMNVDWFGRMYTEGHFSITSLNRNINYLKMTISGKNNFKTVSNSVKWSYLNNSSANFLGIDWNVAESDNCDNCGRSYSTGLNHRSILYWQTGATNGTYEDNQWFHAQSLSLTDSTGPDNDFQDFEFYYKSK